jgi:hypothetical protein
MGLGLPEAIIGSTLLGMFGAKKQADSAKDAAKKQAAAIAAAEEAAALRNVEGKALASDVKEEAEVSLGGSGASRKKRKTRVDLKGTQGAGSLTGIGGL